MKPFNLEEALKGAPVKLRDGSKAFLFCDVTKLAKKIKVDFPILGVYLNDMAYDCEVEEDYWDIDGNYTTIDECSPKDVIGMWEEPELTQEQILEKAYQENLKVMYDKALFTNGYNVIAKTKDGKYILQNESYLTQTREDMTNFRIYEEKPSTVTVTLPRPFKPEIGDHFYYIYSEPYSGMLKVSRRMFDQDDSNAATQDGNRFRTLDDAKAWLNTIREAVDE